MNQAANLDPHALQSGTAATLHFTGIAALNRIAGFGVLLGD